MLKNLLKDNIIYINNNPNKVIELHGNILRISNSKGEHIIRIHNVNQNVSTGEYKENLIKVSLEKI